MARPISDEELQLKKRARRRLVGAIVLVTAMAVILPMVLDSEPRPVSENVEIQIPSPESGEFKPKGTIADARPIKGLPEATEAKPPASTASAPEPVAADSGKVAEAPAADKPKDTAKTPPRTAPRDGAYVVQVAALADAAKARQLEKRVAAAGLKTYTETVSTQAGEVTRVRAGPFPTREAAEKARTQLKQAGLEGQVVPR